MYLYPQKNVMKKIIIIGATSGIGREIAIQYARQGHKVGIAGRRAERLEEIHRLYPEHIATKVIDITRPDAADGLHRLIQKTGGMDIFLQSSGIGHQNYDLTPDIELKTAQTNTEGFIRMVTAAYHYFAAHGLGQIAVICSIAGTIGLGIAPAYSATKRFQNTYLDALEQLARMHRYDISFTDIRPGFVATDLLNDGKHYPLLMRTDRTAAHAITAIRRKRRVAVIDWKYRLLVAAWRLIPRWLWKRMAVRN